MSFSLDQRLARVGTPCTKSNSRVHRLLGKGWSGKVYLINPHTAVKSVGVSDRFNHKDSHKRLDSSWPGENPWREVYLYQKGNELIERRFTQNIMLMHSYHHDVSAKKLYICMEAFDSSVKTFLDENITTLKSRHVACILFQILHGLIVLQKCLGFEHGDLKLENVLIKRIPKGGFWRYDINGEVYYIPNMGFITGLSDFGMSVAKEFPLKGVDRDAYPTSQHALETSREAWLVLNDILTHVSTSKSLQKSPFIKLVWDLVSKHLLYRRWPDEGYDIHSVVSPITSTELMRQLFAGMYANPPDKGKLIDTFTLPQSNRSSWRLW